jgi:hypothetical protein
MGSHFVPSLRQRSSADTVLQRNSPGVHEGGSQLGTTPVLQDNAELQAVLCQVF